MPETKTDGLVQDLLGLPIFQSEWVLWLLIGLSILSIGVIIERLVFYQRKAVPFPMLRRELKRALDSGDFETAAKVLGRYDSLETNVVLAGLRAYEKGPDSVEDLMAGALGEERARYETRLQMLATLASNAPYIGLFGTVLGIVRSFKDMAANMADASSGVMTGIAEALLATAAGLLVAIPAVMFYNYFKGVVKKRVIASETMSLDVLAQLKDSDTRAVESRGKSGVAA
jgi:biopolymer transport protein ExbB/TolQ